MKDKNKFKEVFKITHSGELLIWLIIVFIIVSFSSVFYSKNIQEDNDYTIFMNDVDGLIVGSPVRIMGIEVGHITKIKPTNTEIYVKFVITNKDMHLPQGTSATVEFSGMAGSKSLELYLPEKDTYLDKNVPFIQVNSPKRLHDAAGLLNDMFDKLGSIMYTTSSFGAKLDFLNINVKNSDGLEELIDYADTIIDETNNKRQKILKNTRGRYHNESSK